MSISTPFIQRPVATTLFVVAITLAGGIAYTLLPVAALPEVDFPTITVQASLPGASPDVMPPRSPPRSRSSSRALPASPR